MLRADPVGEDTVTADRTRADSVAGDDLYARAEAQLTDGAEHDDDYDDDDSEQKPTNEEFLQLVRAAEDQAQLYINQVNRKSWSRTYRAFHQEHFVGSKYGSDDFRNRSKIFIPKTRNAVIKDMAAVAASLFGSVDAVSCMPGNESDPQQQGGAAVVQEILNYRTDRASGKASLPWFHVALGARQNAVLTGVCLSKQSWKLELRKDGTEDVSPDLQDGDDETTPKQKRDVWKPFIDRPDSQLIPPENFVIDPAADWTNPAQDAAYIIIKWPMRLDEIRAKQKDPRRPWNQLTESQLRGGGEKAKFDMAAIRRAREQGLDRFDEANNSQKFDIIWVYETYIRTAGEDWTFLSVGDKCMLTDPMPVSEVYPEQFGERPLTMGIGSFEAHRLFPMSSAESWQMLQMEANDLRNLTLDAIKQNVTPVTKVVRGRQVDLDSLKRRGQGTSIMVTAKDDVTWERPPDVPASVTNMTQKLDIDFDDAAGQQNYGTVDSNNNLSKTLGGLKLAAGSANAVQEFLIRIWVETWCEPTLAQLVRLIQFYESDTTIIGLCGERANLMEKYGIDSVTNELLENEVTLRVNIGLGTGDPSQRLAKFQDAINVAMPLLQMDPDFTTGKKQMNGDAVMQEVFGAVGYRDGGKRFVKPGQQQGPSPAQDAATDKLKSDAEKNRATAKASVLTALAAAAKVGLGQRELENAWTDSQFQNSIAHMDQLGRAVDLGHQHADAHMARQNAARGVNPDGTPLVQPGMGDDTSAAATPGGTSPTAGPTDVGAGNSGVDPSQIADHGVPAGDAGQQLEQDAASSQANLEKAQPRKRTLIHHRDPKTNRIVATDVIDHNPPSQEAAPGPAPRAAQPAPAAHHGSSGGGQDHSKTIAQLADLVKQLNAPKKVVRGANGEIVGLHTGAS
jgi:hypothetical protein